MAKKTVMIGSTAHLQLHVRQKAKELGGWSFPVITTGIVDIGKIKKAKSCLSKADVSGAINALKSCIRKHPYDGVADEIIVLNGYHIEVEIKNKSTGDSIKPHQAAHAIKVMEAGGLQFIATSIEQIEAEIFPVLEGITACCILENIREIGPTHPGPSLEQIKHWQAQCAQERGKPS